MNHSEAFISTKEAMNLLSCTVQTIYHYVKAGKLHPINKEDWQIDGTYYFKKIDIEKLKKIREKPGFTTREAAKCLQLSVSTVLKDIKNGYLPARKEIYQGKQQYFIKQKDLDLFRKSTYYQKKTRKKAFFSKENNRYLFEPFEHKETGEFGRVIELNEKNGTFLTEGGTILPITKIEKYNYRSIYPYQPKKYVTSKGYATFVLKAPSLEDAINVRSDVFSVLDLLYTFAGVENMQLEKSGGEIKVRVKKFFIPKLNLSEKETEMIRESIVSGEIKESNDRIVIQPPVESLSIYIETSLKEKAIERAEQANLSLESFVIQLLEQALQKK
ncbi:helix-turn-helix domain-containing protein [Bacillus chungangensis]|uniref:DNA-binding transcriptional MerR regulator n=1 Tax=Bacillus chungangensis TaxID=587633 RepID=A0ABT9WY61_9BACI|nr:helix-turn-helix domain-containing protein [Bacillus chungangensis]MDQ0178069.1 DNA-binding transcriptional MerR regulator [Bacillus chungangensis]